MNVTLITPFSFIGGPNENRIDPIGGSIGRYGASGINKPTPNILNFPPTASLCSLSLYLFSSYDPTQSVRDRVWLGNFECWMFEWIRAQRWKVKAEKGVPAILMVISAVRGRLKRWNDGMMEWGGRSPEHRTPNTEHYLLHHLITFTCSALKPDAEGRVWIWVGKLKSKKAVAES